MPELRDTRMPQSASRRWQHMLRPDVTLWEAAAHMSVTLDSTKRMGYLSAKLWFIVL